MSFSTAGQAYGYRYPMSSANSGSTIMAETQFGESGANVGAAMGPLPLHWDNPLFWLLALFLIFTGWLYLGGEVGVRKIGRLSAKSG